MTYFQPQAALVCSAHTQAEVPTFMRFAGFDSSTSVDSFKLLFLKMRQNCINEFS